MPSLSAMKDLDAADALPKGLGEPIRPEVKTERQRDLEKRQSEISNFETMKDTVKEAAKPAPKGLPVAQPMFDRDAFEQELLRQRNKPGGLLEAVKALNKPFGATPRSAGSSSFDEMYRQVFGMARDRTEMMKTPARRYDLVFFDDYAENETPEIRERIKAELLKARRAAPTLEAEARRLWKDA